MLEILVAPICFGVDQYMKNMAVRHSQITPEREILSGKVKLGLVYNKGAFLGLLGNHKRLLMLANIGSLVILSCLAVGLFITKGQHVLKLGVSFMLGGALGNIYDRLKRKKVVDFFSFQWKPNIYFNLADMFVFIGGFFILIGTLLSNVKK